MISTILFEIAGICWAVMNTLTFHRSSSVFKWAYKYSFWGESSWALKYKFNPDEKEPEFFFPAPYTWYYRRNKLQYKERFPLSATMLVFLTDGYHLMQFIMLWCIALSLVFFPLDLTGEPWYVIAFYAVIMRLGWWVAFNVTFTLLKRG